MYIYFTELTSVASECVSSIVRQKSQIGFPGGRKKTSVARFYGALSVTSA